MSYDPETTAIFDELWDARVARCNAHLERIANTAYWLGRKLAKHEITKDDVDRRIDALCKERDPELKDSPVGLAPWDLANQAAIDGLRRGMGTGQ